jgi:hypothetical protein
MILFYLSAALAAVPCSVNATAWSTPLEGNDAWITLEVGSCTDPMVIEWATFEGDAGSTGLRFPVTLGAPAAYDIYVDYWVSDITATAGVDFENATGSVVIPSGFSTATVIVQVYGDTDIEGDEQFELVASTNATSGWGMGEIAEDDIWIFSNPEWQPEDEPSWGLE